MKNLNKILFIIAAITTIFAAIFFVGNIRQKNMYKEQKELIKVSNDSLQHYKDEFGKQKAMIKILETQSLKTFIEFNTLNKSVKELQTLVKRNQKLISHGGSAAIIKTETKIDTFVKTEVDTFNNIYVGRLENKWINLISISDKDTTHFQLKSFSKLNLVLSKGKSGLFKKKEPYAIVNDDNPYTNIKDMRVYQVKSPKPDRFIIGPSIGYGISVTSEKINRAWFVGATLTYRLISF